MKSKKNRKNNLSLSLQHNKYVMYILLVAAVINLLMYLQKNYLGSILLFFAVGLITTLYTKNMNIILFSTIIITNLTVFVAKMFGYKEGAVGDMEGGAGSKKMWVKPLGQIYVEGKKPKDDEEENFIGFRGGAKSIDQLTGEAFQEGYAGKKEGNPEMKKKSSTKSPPPSTTPPPQLTKPKPPKPPKPTPMADDEDDEDEEQFKNIKEDIAESEALTKSLRKNNISKDTEKEIKKMLKGTDLKNLDTNELIQQQKGLMDAMKNMDPLIKNVNDMITNLKNSPISSFMGLGK